MASTHNSTRPSAVKSMPRPGTTLIALSMSANRPLPCSRSRATACALLIPAGSRPPMTPLKMMSVACPRMRGPSTDSVTLVTAQPSASATDTRSGRSMPSSRLPDPLKSKDFAGGPPIIIMRPGPKAGGAGRDVLVGALMRRPPLAR
jgi:hypothetical protein